MPRGGLCDARIIELVAMAEDAQSHFHVDYTNASYIMHVWMHHLLGGEKAGLTPPSEDKRSKVSKWVRATCQRLAESDRKDRRARAEGARQRGGDEENGDGGPSNSTVCLEAIRARLRQADSTQPVGLTDPAGSKRKAPSVLGECDSPSSSSRRTTRLRLRRTRLRRRRRRRRCSGQCHGLCRKLSSRRHLRSRRLTPY